ncbi:MAG: DNA mismatch endonuclease Vsr [Polyangiaceae bacterium]|nr:DNA mismatch endonuclease Vsr [Polyangiaceae bacterium]
MADNLTPSARRKCMAAVRGRDSGPELALRKLVRQLGERGKPHNSSLPGTPDLSNRTRRWAIFVHGCFWHGHRSCPKARLPTTNTEFWSAKIRGNAARDRLVQRRLRDLGFRILIVWECQLRDPDRVLLRLRRFLPGRQLEPTLKRPENASGATRTHQSRRAKALKQIAELVAVRRQTSTVRAR